MKNIIILSAAVLGLASCKTVEQNARLAAIGNLAINYGESKGVITPEDAAFARESGKLLLTPAPAVIAAETASK